MKLEIIDYINSIQARLMVLDSEERRKRLAEFHKGYDENVLDGNLKKGKTRVMETLSEYFNREMILADECNIFSSPPAFDDHLIQNSSSKHHND